MKPNCFAVACYCLVALAGVTNSFGQSQEVERPILFNLGPSARPWNFTPEVIDHIDSLPFSGITLNMPIAFLAMHSVEYGPFTEQELHGQFGDLDFSFNSVDQNWVSVVVRRNGTLPAEGDFFDDAAWETTVDQFRLLARVARNPRYQCKGIFFDNEEYFEGVWNYPADVAFAQTYSLAEYQDKARQRGQEIFQAIESEWPEAEIIFAHGPYLSAPEDRPFEVSMDQVAGWWEYELFAPFFYGMAEIANDQQIIDGGEVYQLRTVEQFAINHDWRTNDIANSIVVPDILQDIYSDRVGVTHGLYNLSWPTPQDVMNPEIMRTTLNNALRSNGQHVWIFTEAGDTWLEPGGFSQAWRDNIEAGFSDAIVTPGDVNEDGEVNLLDVDPFVVCLSGGNFHAAADVNGDDVVNLLDVGPFISLLSN